MPPGTSLQVGRGCYVDDEMAGNPKKIQFELVPIGSMGMIYLPTFFR